MPNIKSAIKRVKIAEKKTLENSRVKSEYKTAIKKFETANAAGDKEAAELLKVAKKKIDSAAKKNVISKNAASRKKSKLDKKLAVKPEAKKVAKKEEKAEEKAPAKKATTAKKTAEKKETAKKTTTKKTAAKKEEK